jgi:hypothetical protein
VTYPDGWSDTGVTDTQSALESHYRAVLTGPSATVQYRSRIVSAESDQAANTTMDMRLDTGGRRLSARIDGTERTREVFFADGTFRQWSVRNETVVGRSNATFVRAAQSIDNGVLRSQLLTYRLELNGTVTRGGTTALVYDVVGVYNNTRSGTYGTATAASGRVVVSERGRVVDLQTTVTYTRGTVAYRYSQTRIGGTEVPTPEWLSAA